MLRNNIVNRLFFKEILEELFSNVLTFKLLQLNGFGMLECFENIVPHKFLCSFWNKIPKMQYEMFSYEFLKLQSCCVQQTHQKNV
jgi:hypothetical protein